MSHQIEKEKCFEFLDGSSHRFTVDGASMRCAALDLSAPCPKHCNCPRAIVFEARRVNPWTDVEKCIFLDRFLQYPKNFRKIASYLKNKTTQDVIAFYYDSKKSINYKALVKENEQRRKGLEVSTEQEGGVHASCHLCAGLSIQTKPILG